MHHDHCENCDKHLTNEYITFRTKFFCSEGCKEWFLREEKEAQEALKSTNLEG